MDIGWDFELVLVMFNNPNEDFHKKYVGKPKESGQGDYVSG